MATHIELLVIPDCEHADAAAALIETAVADTGVLATVTRTTIDTAEMARERGFIGSPTILINGADPFRQSGAPVALACRLYSTPAGLQGVPTLRHLRQALKRAAAEGP